MCLCLQLHSAPPFAFKFIVQLLLLLIFELGASVCPASVALCSCHKLITSMELHQLLAAFGIERNTGVPGDPACSWGMALTAPGKCCLPSSLTCGFTSVLLLTAWLAAETATKRFLWKTSTANKTEEDLEHVVNSSSLLHRCTHTPHTLLANDDFLIY